MGILISVVVCTFNRAGLLAEAIDTLCHQTLDPSLYEIIVVDNNSTDDTGVVMGNFLGRGNVRYCLEPQQGLSHARNRGWRKAQGEYVAYVDDDCRMPSQWLAVATEVITNLSPGIFGGPFFALYNSPKPAWFRDSYGSYSLGDEPRSLGIHEYIYGGNIFFRRSLLRELGGFNPDLGMSGCRIGFGEETSLQRLARKVMPNEVIYYDPRLYVYHLVRPEKMSLLWMIRACFADGRHAHHVAEGASLSGMSLHRMFIYAAYTFLALGVDNIKGIFNRDLAQYPFLQNYLYEYGLVRIRNFGALYEEFKRRTVSRT